jgi:cyclopropane fatty-acyl-phospholipid synthase-like methyltransferase
LDLACGAGYGTSFLAENCQEKILIGRDISPDAIRFAKEFYEGNNCRFEVEDLRDCIQNDKHDLIVSFETLEHIDFIDLYFENITGNLTKMANLSYLCLISGQTLMLGIKMSSI